MKWIRASERLPEATNGYAKQIVTRWTFDDGSVQLRTTTVNGLLDTTKALIDNHRLEWLDETSTISQEDLQEKVAKLIYENTDNLKSTSEMIAKEIIKYVQSAELCDATKLNQGTER